MQMDKGLDTGPMLMMESIPILEKDTQITLHDKLAKLGGELIVKALSELPTLRPAPQPDSGVTYANKVQKDEAALDFTLPALILERKIRAFNPFPGTHVTINGVTLKIGSAMLAERPTSMKPGQLRIQDHDLLVACGDGALRLLTLQKPGGKMLPVAEFLKGFSLGNHDTFS
jgi:methionyl-tRNA formyltransferase